jgi:regulator of protease activity HflC (stomatin/prohibitin superfamily)
LLAAAFTGFGVLVTALAWAQAVLRAREMREQDEFEELKRKRADAALFTASDETFRARRSRIFFERWCVPAFVVLLFLTQGGAAYALWRWLDRLSPLLTDRATLAMAFFGMLGLLGFLLGKYAAGLARDERHRMLRPSASYLLLGAFLFTLAITTEAVGWLGYARVDALVARALTILLALVALENGVNLLLEIYRPRGQRGELRLLYESRLLGLLSQPGGLISTAAQALDYQFGFKVSETWFYRWLENALAWLILMQAGVLWLATALVIVEPHEEALLERFGRRLDARGALQPGLHLKWPMPIETTRIVSTREARSFNIGFIPDPKLEAQRTLLWTKPHYKEEFNLLVASREQGDEAAAANAAEASVPVNLLTVSIPVQFRITNALDWTYLHADPATLLERLGTREVAHYLVSVDMEDIMASGRRRAAEELRERIQQRASEDRLGVEILFVGLQDIHPPVQVADAYESVIGATQERETKIHEAHGYRAERVPLAHAEAARRVSEASAARTAKMARSVGTAGMFTNQLAAHAASPGVYQRRAYLDAIVAATAGARKYVLTTTNVQQDFWLNLEDKLRPDLLDVPVAPVAPDSKKP